MTAFLGDWVRVSVMVRVSIRTSWVVNFALFRCYRPVIYTRPFVLLYFIHTSNENTQYFTIAFHVVYLAAIFANSVEMCNVNI